MSKHTVTLEEDENGDLVLPLSDEVLKEVGWKEGDNLNWKDNNDGSFTLTKNEGIETEWVLVETISQFRQRYVVEVPKGKSEYALDTVTMDEAKEFSQKHLGETIVSHRIVSEEEAISICDVDNDYCREWTSEKKTELFFTKAGEEVKL